MRAAHPGTHIRAEWEEDRRGAFIEVVGRGAETLRAVDQGAGTKSAGGDRVGRQAAINPAGKIPHHSLGVCRGGRYHLGRQCPLAQQIAERRIHGWGEIRAGLQQKSPVRRRAVRRDAALDHLCDVARVIAIQHCHQVHALQRRRAMRESDRHLVIGVRTSRWREPILTLFVHVHRRQQARGRAAVFDEHLLAPRASARCR